eukprot:TRINITY_DN2308_c0_g1_i1.p1 TRINITY_DN2308_c0_g1~~TRINITY_DN2308_c0_g1_i1.p1  ORF type:complete len:71 (-),score=3.06 TRINITY_DN2308_c0_g1_i1:104-316(-)
MGFAHKSQHSYKATEMPRKRAQPLMVWEVGAKLKSAVVVRQEIIKSMFWCVAVGISSCYNVYSYVRELVS